MQQIRRLEKYHLNRKRTLTVKAIPINPSALRWFKQIFEAGFSSAESRDFCRWGREEKSLKRLTRDI